MTTPLHISSRDNPLLQKLRKLSQDGASYRKLGEIWLEGDHLCRAAVQHGRTVLQAVLSETAWQDPRLRELADAAARVVIVAPSLFKTLTTLESPSGIGFVLPLEPQPALQPAIASIVLDRLQDAGNVGSILRSVAAFGVGQVIALKGSVALWSPKVLRAAMGAHFAVHLVEGLEPNDLDALRIPLIGTSSHAKDVVHDISLPDPCAWVFGHEGQGIDVRLQRRCALLARIPQPGGEESLNVSAAAAVCLYESSRQRSRARLDLNR